MTPERWRQITGVFHDALTRDAETRALFLEEVCVGDEALRAEVIALLEAHQNAGEFGESPIRAFPQGAADVGADLGGPDTEVVSWMGGPGMTLGSYRIERLLGRGGMGVVYLAYDTTLHRQVALKVLGAPADGGTGRARLLREARNAAALNHPSICTVYEVGEADGCAFIAMEYVDGRPLSDRLAESALPLKEAVQHGIEAADALGCAHDRGVIHRDLKAANAMVTTAGRLKLVDFGLARREDARLADATTMPSLAPSGIAIGTPYSMAPEQVRGGVTDARTDIWALGVLLYEMVSGAKPFTAPTTSELFSSILRDAPALLPDATPVTLRSVIERCLEKDSGRRYQHTREVRAALEEIQAGRVPPGAASRAQVRRRPWVAAAAGVLALVTLLVAVIVVWQRPEPDPPAASPGRFTFSQLTSQPGAEWFPSLSPDGKWLVYSGQASGNRDIYLQSVGGQNPINLTADFREDDDQPAFSPDGERIAFRSSRQGGGIFVMGLTGEAPRRVTSAGFRPSWSPDGTAIAYSTENVDVNPQNDYGTSELWLVEVETGKARNLNVNDAVQASFSPDGRRLAVTARHSDTRQMDIVSVLLDGGETDGLVTGPAIDWNPVWSPDGRYLYYSSNRGGSMNLWRVPIDLSSGRARGEPDPVTTPATFAAHPSISSDGKLLAFSSVTSPTNVARLGIDPTTATAKGEPSDVTSGSRRWSSPDPSPDGQWVTFYSAQNPESLYIARADGTSQRQLTNDAAIDRVPRWSPDGDRIAFFSNRSGPYAVWTIHADGSGLRQVSGTEEMAVYPTWSHDGSRMVTSDAGNASLPSLAKTFIFDPNRPLRDQAPEVLPPFPSTVGGFVPNSWSPDGQKLAGQISLTPQGIATYSLRSRTFDLLTDFGEFPVWLPDSRRLLFVAGGRDFFVLDTETRQSRKMYTATRGVLGPPRLTRDGRSAYFTRRMTESDIWLLKIE